jgi:hypothetical protein
MKVGQLARATISILSLGVFTPFSTCRENGDRSRPDDQSSLADRELQAKSPRAATSSTETSTCAPGPQILCLVDTAYGIVNEGNPAGFPLASWIAFSYLGDSVIMKTTPRGDVSTMIGITPDSLHNASADGVRFVAIALDQQSTDTVRYTLEVRLVGAEPSALMRATGKTATLELQPARIGTRFSVIPLSSASGVRDRVRWTVPRGVHKVLLVADSLYEVCRMPCAVPDTVKLQPDTRVRARY